MILESARGEFLAHGYGSSRIQAVADRAGITVGLVYKHFESKEELFQAAVVAPLHGLLRQRIAEIQAMPVDAGGLAQLSTIVRFFHTLLETFVESIGSMGVVLFGTQDDGPEFYRRHLRPLIDAAVDASRTSFGRWPHRDFDIEIAMEATFGMAFWVALDGAMTGQQGDLAPLAAQLADLLFNGMRER